MKIGSLFSGIGAWEVASRELGIKYELQFFCEVDSPASKSYCAIHGVSASKNLGDITQITEEHAKELPDIDVLVYSPPCTAFSVSGKQLGFEDTRGILFFDALRIIKAKRPPIALMENVKGLTLKKFSKEFEIMLQSLEDLGYKNTYKVLNTKDFGVPQNRERVFLVSTLDHNIDITFPEPFYNGLVLRDFLEPQVEDKYYLSQEKVDKLLANLKNKEIVNKLPKGNAYNVVGTTQNAHAKGTNSRRWVFDIEGNISALMATDYKEPKQIIIPIQSPDRVNKKQNGKRYKEDNDPMYTLTAQDRHGIVQIEMAQTVRVRKYPVDIEKLKVCLRDHKNITNSALAEIMDQKKTTVEHWFRTDKYFCIPEPEVWFKLKEVLNIQTNEFDESIMTFEEREGTFEKAQRYYSEDGILPTLTTGNEHRVIQAPRDSKRLFGIFDSERSKHQAGSVWDKNAICPTLDTMQGGWRQPCIIDEATNFRIRKLTPKECFRLQGFRDSDFEKCVDMGISNTQLYKQAGNSITVDVVIALYKELFKVIDTLE